MTNQWFPDVCAVLPEARLPDEHRTPFVSAVPTLFLSGTLDANTPPHQAYEVAWGWPNASHIVVESAGHESITPLSDVHLLIKDFFSGQDVANRRIDGVPLDFISVQSARDLLRRR